MKWINVKDDLPEELEDDFHKRKLYLKTETFGTMIGFYMHGKFWQNYACEIHNVTDWIILPN